jgi:hypothetical protein
MPKRPANRIRGYTDPVRLRALTAISQHFVCIAANSIRQGTHLSCTSRNLGACIG